MNEPANFDTDNPKPWNCKVEPPNCFTLNCPTNRWDDPPYKPSMPTFITLEVRQKKINYMLPVTLQPSPLCINIFHCISS